MSFKSTLLKIYYLPFLSTDKIDLNQTRIRNIEWEAISKFIKPKAKFLDVGCGAGYAMMRAMEQGCEAYGIDPEPGAHGVGRYKENLEKDLHIVQGYSENLPYEDNSFDIVYCSHVLEHVNDEAKTLQELKRVLKPDGTLIIGMPTASMAWINFYTNVLFTSHQRFVNVVLSPFSFIKTGKTPFVNLFIPPSHSGHRAKTVLFDLSYYKVKNWKKIVASVFKIDQVLLPALYPYPEYWQLFKTKENGRRSSSVFFICKKNE